MSMLVQREMGKEVVGVVGATSEGVKKVNYTDIVETKGKPLASNNESRGEASWKSDYWKETYAKKINGVKVYAQHPREITLGTVMVLRPMEELQVLIDNDAIPCGWCAENSEILEEIGFKLVVDQEVLDNIELNYYQIKEIDLAPYGYEAEDGEEPILSLSLPMFKIESKGEEKKEVEVLPTYSINIPKESYDKEILEEMKSKVDFNRLRVLLSIAGSRYDDKNFVDEKIVTKYLDAWAKAKYPYYILLGRELKVRQDVLFDKTSQEMDVAKKDIMAKFPQYALYLEQFSGEELVKNECKQGRIENSYVRRYAQQFYTRGMKVTKFFSDFCKDKKFDMALSRCLQDKQVKGQLFISIDPYDYLTSSINKAGWDSCHRIGEEGGEGGIHGNGCLAYMLDQATLVAYRCNGVDYDYEIYGFKFKGNSKLHRQLIYCDLDSANFIQSRQYPNDNKHISKATRNMMQALIANATGCGNEWTYLEAQHEGNYSNGSCAHYPDVQRFSSEFLYTRPLNSKANVFNVKVGAHFFCTKCGHKMDKAGAFACCEDCR